jgi:hypothetical protein
MSSAATGNGQARSRPLQPNADALALAEDMIQRDDVMRSIIQETLESGRQGQLTESGRTVCGTARRPLPPILRRFAQVTLPTCPVRVGGTWHTHITREQLLRSENSLPDWANVAFGVVDVSIVVGAEMSEVVVGSADRSVMVNELRQVLGTQVENVEDVIEAILDGQVQDPPSARARLRSQLRPLVFDVDTAFPDLAEEVRRSDVLATLSEIDPAHRRFTMVAACPMYGLFHPTIADATFDRFRKLARANVEDLKRAGRMILPPEDVDIRSQAWGTGIGFFVSQLLSDLLTP